MHSSLCSTPKFIVALFAFCMLVALSPLPAQAQEQVNQEETTRETQEETAPEKKPRSGSTAQKREAAEETVNLEPMVVTGTRVETPLSQVTKSIGVVTSKDRDEQQQYFLPELIDNEPGVYLQRLGGLRQFSKISIRGAPPQYIQYQYNGFSLRDAADTQTSI